MCICFCLETGFNVYYKSNGRNTFRPAKTDCLAIVIGSFFSHITIELAYVFNNPQETIYTGGLYNEELADTVQDMWVNFARSGDPGTEKYAWEPYTKDKRMTMVLGEEVGMVEDLKKEQRELIEPLLPHYFNGCYSQLDFMVPQLGRIIVQLIITAILAAILVIIVKTVIISRKKHRK